MCIFTLSLFSSILHAWFKCLCIGSCFLTKRRWPTLNTVADFVSILCICLQRSCCCSLPYFCYTVCVDIVLVQLHRATSVTVDSQSCYCRKPEISSCATEEKIWVLKTANTAIEKNKTDQLCWKRMRLFLFFTVQLIIRDLVERRSFKKDLHPVLFLLLITDSKAVTVGPHTVGVDRSKKSWDLRVVRQSVRMINPCTGSSPQISNNVQWQEAGADWLLL